MTAEAAPSRRTLHVAGLLLLGQGLLVVTGVLSHEAPLLVGIALVVIGIVLAAWPRRTSATVPAAGPGPGRDRSETALAPRRLAVQTLGLAFAVGVPAFNLLTRSGLSGPELALFLYGVALLLAAPHLGRRLRLRKDVVRTDVEVSSLVAWSFPLLLAPLSLFALDALVKDIAGTTPLRWYVQDGLVAPMGLALGSTGIDVRVLGDTVRIVTARGPLFLTVGVVCAGLYASVLFLGIFARFAWDARTPPRRLALLLGVGLLGLHVANVLRLVLLGYVGYAWGGAALQQVHENAGWLLFLAWTLAFWGLVLRRFEGPASTVTAT